jgi:hypothetical protein
MKLQFLIIFFGFAAMQASAQKKPDAPPRPTAHFVKQIYFILKDSATGATKTISREIKYITTEEWLFDEYTKQREKKKVTHDDVQIHLEPEEVAQIDSIYFDDKYSVEKMGVSYITNGMDLFAGMGNNYIDNDDKAQLKRYTSSKCCFYIDIYLTNQNEEKQHLWVKLK